MFKHSCEHLTDAWNCHLNSLLLPLGIPLGILLSHYFAMQERFTGPKGSHVAEVPVAYGRAIQGSVGSVGDGCTGKVGDETWAK